MWKESVLLVNEHFANYQYFNIFPLIVYQNAIPVILLWYTIGTVLNYHRVSYLIADFPIRII